MVVFSFAVPALMGCLATMPDTNIALGSFGERPSFCAFRIWPDQRSSVTGSEYEAAIHRITRLAEQVGSRRIRITRAISYSDVRNRIDLNAVSREAAAAITSSGLKVDEQEQFHGSRSYVELYVCDEHSYERARAEGLSDPGRIAPFSIAGESFDIPLSYLNSFYWLNTPLQRMEVHSIELRLTWPGLLPVSPESPQECGQTRGACPSITLLLQRRSARRREVPESSQYVVRRFSGSEYNAVCIWHAQNEVNPRTGLRNVPNAGLCTIYANNLNGNVLIVLSAFDIIFDDLSMIMSRLVSFVGRLHK